MIWVVLLSLSIITQIIAEVTVKSYSLSGQLNMAIVSLILNTLSSLFWMWYMRTHSALAIGSSIWAVSISVAALIIGTTMYHEVISIQQYIGMCLGIVSLFLLF